MISVCISWTNKGFNIINEHGATTKIHEDWRVKTTLSSQCEFLLQKRRFVQE